MVGETLLACVLADAERRLGVGESVILDATWGRSDLRASARAAAGRTSSRIAEMRCEAPSSLRTARLRTRTADGTSPPVSAAVSRAMAADEEPWPEAVAVPTGAGSPGALRRALALLGR